MSARELPPDLDDWPRDPYELLGVKPGVSPRDLRRAYTQLIRAYKPEQHPDHFRRIREAYETVMRWEESFGFSPSGPFAQLTQPAESPAPPAEEAAPSKPPEAAEELHAPRQAPSSDEEPAPARPQQRTLDDDLRDAWQLACSGGEAEAYQQLLKLYRTHSNHPDVCKRLYWLLAVMPELDPERPACEWLTRGLRSSGLAGPLRELYRRELLDDPREVLDDRSADLLICNARPALLADLAEWRWQAAGRLERWDIVEQDLAALRERVQREDDVAWLRLLFAAANELAWEVPTRGALERYHDEIHGYDHLHQQFQADWDRLDFLIELARQWISLRSPAPHRGKPRDELLEVVARAWRQPVGAYRPLLMNVLHSSVQGPRAFLNTLDKLQEEAPAVLAQFGHALQSLQFHTRLPDDRRPMDALSRIVLDFLSTCSWLNYGDFRTHLLEFCLREAVPPEAIVQVADARQLTSHEPYMPLGELITNDWPLRYVYLGQCLFWA